MKVQLPQAERTQWWPSANSRTSDRGDENRRRSYERLTHRGTAITVAEMRRHLFVCTNDRASGKPACGRRGGVEIVTAVQKVLIARGSDARVTACGCLGPCFDGPNAVLYPEGHWYGGLDETDAEALADAMVSGEPHTPRLTTPPGEDAS
jgi:(2Fe-2S) ferredoxin